MLGTQTNTSSSLFTSDVFPNTSRSTLATGVIDFNLQKNWTVSEVARIGYFVTPKTLVYGGLGWSVSGFDLVDNFDPNAVTGGCAAPRNAIPGDLVASGSCTFTLNGFTWTAGVEQDFGGWRGFLQFKGVNYRGKDVIILGQNNGSSTTTGTFGTTTVVQGFTDVRHVSASTLEFNAGITIPLGVAFNHWRP
jgi:opacity protein-like surface antigen